MKTLIYTVCFGLEKHYILACEWVNSIRRTGCADKIIIVSEKDFECPGAEVIVARFMTQSQLWKSAICKLVDLSSYDKILYMDTDIPCLQNPHKFFELSGIQIPLEPIKVIESGLNPVFLTPEEVTLHGNEHSWNAGTLILPGKHAETFLTEWEDEWKKIDYKNEKDYWPDTKIYKGQMYDQGILQLMICRNLFSKMPIPMPKSFVGFPALEECGEQIALHLCGLKHTDQNKKYLLDVMVALRDKSKVKQICAELMERANPMKSIGKKLESAVQMIRDQDQVLSRLIERINKLEWVSKETEFVGGRNGSL